MKEVITVCLLTVGIVFFVNRHSHLTSSELKEEHNFNSSIILSNTLERVLIDGVWWIYEYNEEGKLVNIYPDEE